MYLFILESIGTPELLLIAIVALIVFGPRRLPEMAKKMAKTMAEFKNVTSEFKSTWEKEVAFEEEILTEKTVSLDSGIPVVVENSISRSTFKTIETKIAAPQVKELSQADIAQNFKDQIPTEVKILPEEKTEKLTGDKRDWI